MKKTLIFLIIASTLFNLFGFNTAFAQGDQSGLQLGTLLPSTTEKDCTSILKDIESASQPPATSFKQFDSDVRNKVLACAIMTGKIHFWMIPYYIVYIIQFLIGIAGLIAILFLVVGGYKYVASGVSEQKDKAKGTITNALLGLVVVMVAWVIVNVVQFIVTM